MAPVGRAPVGSMDTGTAPVGSMEALTGRAPVGIMEGLTGTASVGSIEGWTGRAPVGSIEGLTGATLAAAPTTDPGTPEGMAWMGRTEVGRTEVGRATGMLEGSIASAGPLITAGIPAGASTCWAAEISAGPAGGAGVGWAGAWTGSMLVLLPTIEVGIPATEVGIPATEAMTEVGMAPRGSLEVTIPAGAGTAGETGSEGRAGAGTPTGRLGWTGAIEATTAGMSAGLGRSCELKLMPPGCDERKRK